MEQQKPAEQLLGEPGFVLFKAITRYAAILTSIFTLVASIIIIAWLTVLSAMNLHSHYSPPGIPKSYYAYIYIMAFASICIAGRFMYHDTGVFLVLKQRQKWLFIFFNIVFMFTVYYIETTLSLYEKITFLPK